MLSSDSAGLKGSHKTALLGTMNQLNFEYRIGQSCILSSLKFCSSQAKVFSLFGVLNYQQFNFVFDFLQLYSTLHTYYILTLIYKSHSFDQFDPKCSVTFTRTYNMRT